MQGVIRKLDIIAHPYATIASFGFQVFYRALLAGKDVTFLSLLGREKETPVVNSEIDAIFGACAKLERASENAYLTLAARFSASRPAETFFRTLAAQEADHFQILELCRRLAHSTVLHPAPIARMREHLPNLQKAADATLKQVKNTRTLADAMHIVLALEDSEINILLQDAVESASADFVRVMSPFYRAGEDHLHYVMEQVVLLTPEIATEAQTRMQRALDILHKSRWND